MRGAAARHNAGRDGAAAAPTICTFHALGLKILRREAAAMQLTPRFSSDPTDIEPIVAELLTTSDRARVRAAQWQIQRVEECADGACRSAGARSRPRRSRSSASARYRAALAPIGRSTSTI
jgi:superfamily I DNA/RNA helicase